MRRFTALSAVVVALAMIGAIPIVQPAFAQSTPKINPPRNLVATVHLGEQQDVDVVLTWRAPAPQSGVQLRDYAIDRIRLDDQGVPVFNPFGTRPFYVSGTSYTIPEGDEEGHYKYEVSARSTGSGSASYSHDKAVNVKFPEWPTPPTPTFATDALEIDPGYSGDMDLLLNFEVEPSETARINGMRVEGPSEWGMTDFVITYYSSRLDGDEVESVSTIPVSQLRQDEAGQYQLAHAIDTDLRAWKNGAELGIEIQATNHIGTSPASNKAEKRVEVWPKAPMPILEADGITLFDNFHDDAGMLIEWFFLPPDSNTVWDRDEWRRDFSDFDTAFPNFPADYGVTHFTLQRHAERGAHADATIGPIAISDLDRTADGGFMYFDGDYDDVLHSYEPENSNPATNLNRINYTVVATSPAGDSPISAEQNERFRVWPSPARPSFLSDYVTPITGFHGEAGVSLRWGMPDVPGYIVERLPHFAANWGATHFEITRLVAPANRQPSVADMENRGTKIGPLSLTDLRVEPFAEYGYDDDAVGLVPDRSKVYYSLKGKNPAGEGEQSSIRSVALEYLPVPDAPAFTTNGVEPIIGLRYEAQMALTWQMPITRIENMPPDWGVTHFNIYRQSGDDARPGTLSDDDLRARVSVADLEVLPNPELCSICTKFRYEDLLDREGGVFAQGERVVYTITANNPTGTSTESAAQEANIELHPTPPAPIFEAGDLSHTPGFNGVATIRLQWELDPYTGAVAEFQPNWGANQFLVYRKSASDDSNWSIDDLIARIRITQVQMADGHYIYNDVLTADEDHNIGDGFSYRIRAKNGVGTGNWSETQTFAAAIWPAPAAPSLDTPSSEPGFAGEVEVTLTWEIPTTSGYADYPEDSGIDAFYIYRKPFELSATQTFTENNLAVTIPASDIETTEDGKYRYVDTIPTDVGYSDGRPVAHNVRAGNPTGKSEWSNTGTTVLEILPPPPPATMVSVEPVVGFPGDAAMQITWELGEQDPALGLPANWGVTHFEIERGLPTDSATADVFHQVARLAIQEDEPGESPLVVLANGQFRYNDVLPADDPAYTNGTSVEYRIVAINPSNDFAHGTYSPSEELRSSMEFWGPPPAFVITADAIHGGQMTSLPLLEYTNGFPGEATSVIGWSFPTPGQDDPADWGITHFEVYRAVVGGDQPHPPWTTVYEDGPHATILINDAVRTADGGFTFTDFLGTEFLEYSDARASYRVRAFNPAGETATLSRSSLAQVWGPPPAFAYMQDPSHNKRSNLALLGYTHGFEGEAGNVLGWSFPTPGQDDPADWGITHFEIYGEAFGSRFPRLGWHNLFSTDPWHVIPIEDAVRTADGTFTFKVISYISQNNKTVAYRLKAINPSGESVSGETTGIATVWPVPPAPIAGMETDDAVSGSSGGFAGDVTMTITAGVEHQGENAYNIPLDHGITHLRIYREIAQAGDAITWSEDDLLAEVPVDELNSFSHLIPIRLTRSLNIINKVSNSLLV